MAELQPEFGPGKISRINRDIRFTGVADKSPCKTSVRGPVTQAREGTSSSRREACMPQPDRT
jgi:hypothetical protein